MTFHITVLLFLCIYKSAGIINEFHDNKSKHYQMFGLALSGDQTNE